MELILSIVGILFLSHYFFGVKTIGLFIALLGFAMLTSSPALALWLMALGLFLFIAIRSTKK